MDKPKACPPVLDKERLKTLLEQADDKWFRANASRTDYRGHLEFIADYIAKNYHKVHKDKEATHAKGRQA